MGDGEREQVRVAEHAWGAAGRADGAWHGVGKTVPAESWGDAGTYRLGWACA
jgi:hypothetical protein